jgi:predicted dinucleotide-binding enzyme
VRIAVIGCGRMGSALAVALSRRQIPATVAARRQRRADELAAQLPGIRAASGFASAVDGATAVALAVPAAAAVQELAGQLRAAVAGRTVLDMTNPGTGWPPAPVDPRLPGTAQELAWLLPEASVAKAFNTVPAVLLPHPTLGEVPVTVPIAADTPAAFDTAAELAEALGFEPVSAGPLRNGVLLEQLAGVLQLLGTESGHGARVGFHLARGPISGAAQLVGQ